MSMQTHGSQPATRLPTAQQKIDEKLEVIVLPVSDVDRARRFYSSLGWRLDADFATDDWRIVQMTPTGSLCSIQFGKGITTVAPGSVKGTYLVVGDLVAARADLVKRGVNVSEIFHFKGGLQVVDGTNGRVSGPDPSGNSYRSWASFEDPDGNGWLLQEIKTRLPGRGLDLNVATVTELLRETETRHASYEASAPKHHWSGWYAAFLIARLQGRTPDEAASDAGLHMEAVRR